MRPWYAAIFALAVSGCAFGQAYTSSTVAGTYASLGYTGDNNLATLAQLSNPSSVAVDSAGNLYIADTYNAVIRTVAASTGIITTMVGNGTQGYGGDGAAANGPTCELSNPAAVAVDSAGNLYIADPGNFRVRKVAAGTGVITTVAGNGVSGYSGDNGPATSAELFGPSGVAVDSAGNLYIADTNNYRVRKVSTSGVITTVAGNGTPGFSGDGGSATSAELREAYGVAVDSAGNLYIADGHNNVIRKVSGGVISTIAGSGPSAAGFSGDGGPATSAELDNPLGVAVDSAGSVYIADLSYSAIRKVTGGVINTIAGGGAGFGGGGPVNGIQVSAPNGVSVDAHGNVFVADTDDQRILELSPPAAIGSAALPAGTVGTAYSQTLSASGGSPPYSNWVLASGALPPGLTLDANAATITGVPTSSVGSPFAFTVILIDSAGNPSSTGSFSIAINQPTAVTIVTPSPLPPGVVGVSYLQAFTAAGGTAPYTNWIISGQLPPGISMPGGLTCGLSCSQTAYVGGTPTAAGTFPFTIQVTDSTGVTATAKSTLTIYPAGTVSLNPGGIVNSASYGAGGISPGEVITIFGAGIGPNTGVGMTVSGGSVATTLAGAQILIGGYPSPLIYVQATQASAVVPYEVAGYTSAQVQVSYQGNLSAATTVPVVAAKPGIFTLNFSGTGQGTVLNHDFTVNSSTNPAAVGSVVYVYATGEGQTNPGGVDGQLEGITPSKPVQTVTATVGGVAATVQSAGGVTGAVPGIVEVALVVPSTVATSSAAPLVLTIGGAVSQTGVTVAVKNP
jgi:uncharacterized protein (TIGR03437 family)